MPRLTLSDATLRALKPQTRQTFFDISTPGFGVRVTPKGTRTFIIVYGPEKARRWEKIGSYPLVSLSRAREAARNRLSMIQLGLKPEQPELSFPDAYAQFIASYKARNRPKTVYEMERIVKRHLMPKLRQQLAGEITTAELTQIIDRLLPRPAECAATFTAARTIFGWLARRRTIGRSPLENVPEPVKKHARTRVLTTDELRAVWKTAHEAGNLNPDFCCIVKLLILTGQRRSQIAKLQSDWYDAGNRRLAWPAAAMKGSKPHTIPVTEMVRSILESLPKTGCMLRGRDGKKPFNGFSKCKTAFDQRLQIAPWTLHDLRRTFSTGIARLGVPPHIKEMILAHAAAKDPVEAIYDLYSYETEMTDALQKWEDQLQSLLVETGDLNV